MSHDQVLPLRTYHTWRLINKTCTSVFSREIRHLPCALSAVFHAEFCQCTHDVPVLFQDFRIGTLRRKQDASRAMNESVQPHPGTTPGKSQEGNTSWILGGTEKRMDLGRA